MPFRSVLEGTTPSRHASVRSALRLLHEGGPALGALQTDLAAGLRDGAAGVFVDRPTRLLFATDASLYEMEPLAVVYPRTQADVQHVMHVAQRRGLPVLPRGGGTSLAGQGVNHAIVLDFTRHMAALLQVNAQEGWARVQPGLVLAELNRLIRPHGLHFPIDPSTTNQAALGGMIGNNSCGAHSGVYGKTIDNVIAMDVVLSDGSPARLTDLDQRTVTAREAQQDLEGAIYRELRRIADQNGDEIRTRYPNVFRRVSGYNLDTLLETGPVNLARLIVGSEGTLATVVEATLRLWPLPKAKGIVAAHFRTVQEAAQATVVALQHQPAAVEMVDRAIISRCRESLGYRALADFVQGDPGAVLLIEFFADSAPDVAPKLHALRTDLERAGLGYAVITTLDPAAQQRMWKMREAGLGLLMSGRGDAKPLAFVEDAAVTPDDLPRFVDRFEERVRAHGFQAAYYGHASVGCLHIRPLVNVKDAAQLAGMEALAGEIADLVLEFGGSLSGEHGDGILRGVYTERMFGPRITQAFRDLKRAFDPQGLLNPGKIMDTPPFRDNLRLGPSTRSVESPTYLDFSAEGGLARAAEQCNGQGVCRKFQGGMCPSYMVTQDEEHSTRGRANLLRQALNGGLVRGELTGERMHAALDLCVECKACKAECPSGVDMAKLKFEVLARYHDQHGTSLRDRAFARVNLAGRLGIRVGALLNAVGGLRPLRWLLHRTLGIHEQRRLPRFASQSFPDWFQRRRPLPGAALRGDAVFFNDTFTNYFHPEVGRAAVRVLEALGYRVTVLRALGCCGRPAISKGQVTLAKERAARTIATLQPYAERGVPIVGTEPSCLLTLRDEYLDLVPGEASRAVAAQAVLLDELLLRCVADGADVPAIFRDDLQQRILLHTHCHQKALGHPTALAGADCTLLALGLVPGYDVELIDSACCGMAGSFGFEAEHFAVSQAMGARTLFPALDAAPGDTAIAVTGVSCRQQIEQFTRRSPRHSAELLAGALPILTTGPDSGPATGPATAPGG